MITTARQKIIEFSVGHPWLVIGAVLLVTIFFMAQLPKMKTDTDPKNMLPITSAVRQYNDQVEGWFALHPDVIVLGIRNEAGIFNPKTLGRIEGITEAILGLPGVIARDVVSLPTVDDVAVAGDALMAQPLLGKVPDTPEGLLALKNRILQNPVIINRMVSQDGKMTALYIPLEPGVNAKVIADQIKAILAKEPGPEEFYLAGDPVARDTFGAEMFRQMGLFSPIAGLIMFLVLFFMFRSLSLVVANMAVAMFSVIWAMGLFIGLKIPIHIMASMSPVFLMAISTDTVHIFNELSFRFKEVKEKRAAILQTMEAVSTPVLYSDLTTAAGFASLAIGPIIPVRVFGLMVAFGTLVILVMSFTLVPAVMSLMKEKWLMKMALRRDPEESTASRWLGRLSRLTLSHRKAVLLVGLILIVVSVVGLSRIRINNNMVSWFKYGSDIRKADRLVNHNLGGTATLFLVVDGQKEGAISDPQLLRALASFQKELDKKELVGKTTSVADYVKRVNQVLHQDDPRYNVVPESQEAIAQYLLLFNMAAKPRELNNVLDYPYQKANIIVQLKSWDAVKTRQLLKEVGQELASHPLAGAEVKPAGIAYFNMVWNDEVLKGMLLGFILSCILVFFLLVLNYRSWRWGAVSFLPLLFTILVIYGLAGLLGKDFDMPISVLSTLSLGLAIDFAIHFVSRFRQRFRQSGDLQEALHWTVVRPGRGILRNAFLFASGFAVMVFAALTPYITVGVFMMAIMLLSAAATIIYLPALISLRSTWLLKRFK